MLFTGLSLLCLVIYEVLQRCGCVTSLEITGSYLVLLSTVFIILFYSLRAMHLKVLAQSDRKITCGVLDCARQDRRLYWTGICIPLFLFISLLYACVAPIHAAYRHLGAEVWFIVLGMTIDLLRDMDQRFWLLIDPQAYVAELGNRVRYYWTRGQEGRALDQLRLITECCFKAIKQENFLLVRQACLHWEKSVQEIALQIRHQPMRDNATSCAAFIHRQASIIIECASQDSSGICTEVFSALLARISIAVLSLPEEFKYMPTALFEQLSESRIGPDRHRFNSVICALTEACKGVIGVSISSTVSLKEEILKKLSLLERLTKQEFERDKNTQIALLMQPFADIASYLAEKGSSIPDQEEVMNFLKRILAELGDLDTILRNQDKQERIYKTTDLSLDAPPAPFPL